jgi:hypothetical protein
MLALDPNALNISTSTTVNTGVIEIPTDQPMPPQYPVTFNGDLWQLLQEIKTAGISLSGKIAEYTGFYNKIGATITTVWDYGGIDNGVNPDLPQTGTSQPNKSLDKLTFLIMFRLPFRGEVVEVTPPLTDPEADLYNNRKIVMKSDGTYVLGDFNEKLKSNGRVDHKSTMESCQICTITRPHQITNLDGSPFEIGGNDLFYDSPTHSFYVLCMDKTSPMYGPYFSKFGDPMTGADDTWSKKGNDVRSALGLRRLNGAGEQVDDQGNLVDDAGNVVGSDYNTPNAYDYYEINFGDIYPGNVDNDGNPLPPEVITDQAIINVIKTLPIYYFLAMYTENTPSQFVQQPHDPENITKNVDASGNKAELRVNAMRSIKFGTYTANVLPATGYTWNDGPPQGNVDQKTIYFEPVTNQPGHYYVTSSTNVKNYLIEEFAGDEDFTADRFYITGANGPTGLKVRLKTGKYYAENPNIISQAQVGSGSGLTFGLGLDIGQGTFREAYVYDVHFYLSFKDPPTNTQDQVTLHYDSRAEPITLLTDESKLCDSLSNLMGIDKDIITVTLNTNPPPGFSQTGYSCYEISIPAQIGKQADADGYHNIYSHEIFYHKTGQTPEKVLINPSTDSARYVPRPASELPADPNNFSSFEKLLSHFYDTASPPNGNYLDPIHHKNLPNSNPPQVFNAIQFKKALQKIFGLYGGPAKVSYLNSKPVFDTFQMPDYKTTYQKNYDLNFIGRNYYTQNLLTGKIVNRYLASGAAPNLLEKLLLATVSYQGIGIWEIAGSGRDQYAIDSTLKKSYENTGKLKDSRPDPSIILATSSHNQHELKRIFIDRNRNPILKSRRQPFLVSYVEKSQHVLYRGVEA